MKIFKNVFSVLFFKLMIPFFYKIVKLTGEENEVLLIEVHEDKISDSFALVYNELLKENIKTEVFYVKDLIKKGRVRRYFISLIKVANSKVIILNDGYKILNYINLDDKYVVQMWHASGIFKKFAYSTVDNSYSNNQNFDLFPIHKNYDLVTVSSDFVIPFYEEAFNITKKGIVQALGTSRTDYFFDENNFMEVSERIKKRLPNNKKVILYAPTFRGRLNEYQEYLLDINKMKSELSQDYIIILKLHPLIKGHNLATDDEFSFDFGLDYNFSDLSLVSDILITDFSSTVFDWSLLNKPVYSFAPDISEYNQDRGLYIDYNDFFPGPISVTTEELIKDISSDDDKEISLFKEKFMGACDGNSTLRLLEKIKSEL